MKYKAIAWDIDGTLVDSEPLHLRALQVASQSFCVDLSDLPDEKFIGFSIKDVWQALEERYSSQVTEEVWLQQINAYYAQNAHTLTPIAGAVMALKDLASQQIPQVAVSNSNRAVVNANLDSLGVTELFKFTLSLDDVSKGKPDPAPYQQAALELGLLPVEMLAVEDSFTGARSAQLAGMSVALLGEEPPEFPVILIQNPADILKLSFHPPQEK